jgi:hypothetical protein
MAGVECSGLLMRQGVAGVANRCPLPAARDPLPSSPASEDKNMSAGHTDRSQVMATAQEVLPQFGLAFVIDDRQATWAITKSMEGPGLDALRTGQRVQLMLDHHPDFSVVRAYAPQD